MKPYRILIISYAYAPGIGGIESVSKLLAEGLAQRGHEIAVITQTAATAPDAIHETNISRQPTTRVLLERLKWCDVVIQSNVSLSLSWPLLIRLIRRPWIVVNHTPITRPNGTVGWRERLKLLSLRQAKVYAVSKYLQAVTVVGCGTMRNPYDAKIFWATSNSSHGTRPNQLLFVGRIVPAKGLDVLVEALHILSGTGQNPRLSIAGDGPERSAIERLINSYGLNAQITWLGPLRGQKLAAVMRSHCIGIVPSRPAPPEALPLVPVEMLACGCTVIASDQGGLPESLGSCGILVPSNNPLALSIAIRNTLADNDLQRKLLEKTRDHLQTFHPNVVLDNYERAIENAI